MGSGTEWNIKPTGLKAISTLWSGQFRVKIGSSNNIAMFIFICKIKKEPRQKTNLRLTTHSLSLSPNYS